MALKQWLLFSKIRCINLYNSPSDKTQLSEYVSAFHKRILSEVFKDYIFNFIEFCMESEKIK